MTGPERDQPKPSDPAASLDEERLGADLRALLGPAEDAGPPAAVRDAIRARAAMTLRHRRRGRRLRVAGGVIAASVLLCVASVFFLELPGSRFGGQDGVAERTLGDGTILAYTVEEKEEAEGSASGVGDLVFDGRVDVRDARRLALALRDGDAAVRADLNGDGRTDATDLDLMLSRIVSLENR